MPTNNLVLNNNHIARLGDTKHFSAPVTLNDVPLNVTGKLLIFIVKRSFSDADEDAVMELTTEDRITIVDGSIARWSILPEDWEAKYPNPIAKPITLKWGLLLVIDAAQVHTIDGGDLRLMPGVRRG